MYAESGTKKNCEKHFVKKMFFEKNKIGHFEILNFLNFRFFFERLFLMWSLSTLELKVFFIYGGRCAKFPLGGEKLQSFFSSRRGRRRGCLELHLDSAGAG